MNKHLPKSFAVLVMLLLALNPMAYSKTKAIAKSIMPKISPASTPINTGIAANKLGGTAVNEQGETVKTTASFLVQLANKNEAKPGGDYAAESAVDLQGRINTAATDIGQSGEIFIVAVYNGNWYMRTQVLTGPPGQQVPQDSWIPWNQQIPQLQPAEPAQTLTNVIDFDIVSSLSILGNFQVYIGYRSAGILHYSPQPLVFSLIACNTPQVIQDGACVNPPVPLSVNTVTGKLNDTGIITCSNATNGLSCPQATHPSQDAESGRDVTHNDPSDGHVGFSFTKISSTGLPLPASATTWSCIKDNVTGLIWEVKTDDNGLHDKDWTYTWFDTDNTRNGGHAGTHTPPDAHCGNTSDCDTNGFMQAVNAAGWCGASDWRMPTRGELLGITIIFEDLKLLDTDYFLDNQNNKYWAGSAALPTFNGDEPAALGVFGNHPSRSYKSEFLQVRLVRDGQ